MDLIVLLEPRQTSEQADLKEDVSGNALCLPKELCCGLDIQRAHTPQMSIGASNCSQTAFVILEAVSATYSGTPGIMIGIRGMIFGDALLVFYYIFGSLRYRLVADTEVTEVLLNAQRSEVGRSQRELLLRGGQPVPTRIISSSQAMQ